MPKSLSPACLNGNHTWCYETAASCGCACHNPGESGQGDLFNQDMPEPDGLGKKERGMEQAIDGALAAWKNAFRECAQQLADSQQPFTSETIIGAIGLPSGAVATNANNSVGAMMNGLAKRGVIRKTGQRVLSKRQSSHGAELAEWVGT